MDYALDEIEPVDELTSGQQLHNPEYGARMKHLNDVRYLTRTTTPCQEDPQTWDSIDLEYSWKSGRLHVRQVDLEREVARIEMAVEGCRRCPLLKDCEPLKEVATSQTTASVQSLKTDAEGVIAGTLIDTTATGRIINQYLATGEWRKDLKINDGDKEGQG